MRLTGESRTWLECVPMGTILDDVITRFRQRFGAGDTSITEFWERHQGPADESARRYQEEKARLTRRARVGNERRSFYR